MKNQLQVGAPLENIKATTPDNLIILFPEDRPMLATMFLLVIQSRF